LKIIREISEYYHHTKIVDWAGFDGARVANMEPFQGKINPDVDAEAYSEFVEHLTDDGDNRELVVIAPHGGDIEEHTDEQAEEVAKQPPSKGVSVWMCKGL
jgi:hypothetical protein